MHSSFALTAAILLRLEEPAAQASIVSIRLLVGPTLRKTIVIDVVEITALLRCRRGLLETMHEASVALDVTSCKCGVKKATGEVAQKDIRKQTVFNSCKYIYEQDTERLMILIKSSKPVERNYCCLPVGLHG